MDFVLIAGDLFHTGQILPRTFARTIETLQPLKDSGIPCIAVEGNHDWIHRRDSISWMEALSQMGYIHLLRPTRTDTGGYQFNPFDCDKGVGGHIKVKGLNIYGLGYIGTLAGNHVARICETITTKNTYRTGQGIEENRMEIKICANCEFCWEGQEDLDSSNREPCAKCGSISRKFDMFLQETANCHEAWKGKIKDQCLPSKKKVRVEFFDGQEWSVALEKFINKVIVRDKRQDHYHEKVVDPDTSEVIHECVEPLSQHQGHGSAKFKDDKSKS